MSRKLTAPQMSVFVSWLLSPSAELVAKALNRPLAAVLEVVAELRRQGIDLPRKSDEPRPSGPKSLALTAAQERLFRAYQPLVVSTIRRLRQTRPHIARLGDDAEQVGYVALVRAIQTFDPSKGKLAAYATRAIIRDVYHESNRQFGQNTCKVHEHDILAWDVGDTTADPAETLIHDEEVAQVESVIGPMPSGKSERQDLVTLARRYNLPLVQRNDDLRRLVATAIREQLCYA